MTYVRFRAITANSKVIKSPNIVAALSAAQLKWAEDSRRKLLYPPPEPLPSYDRTGDLGRGWHITGPHLSGSGLVVNLINNVEYAEKVYGDEQGSGQAWMHVGRWPLLQDVIDRDEYVRLIRNVIKDATE